MSAERRADIRDTVSGEANSASVLGTPGFTSEAVVKRDDLFVRNGIAWRRQWVGDNAGRYEWSSDCGRMKVWRSGRIYVTCVDGQVFQAPQATLLGAMNAAFHAAVHRDSTGEAA